MLNVKNLFAGFVCSVLLVGCQGNSVEVNPEKNVEQGISAADYFEYSLQEEFENALFETDSLILLLVTDVKSDSESLVISMYGYFFNDDEDYDYYIKSFTNEAIDMAKTIKGFLVQGGYSQDVYIEFVNEDDKVVSTLSNDSEYFGIE